MSLKILNRYLSYSLLFVISSHIGRLPSWTFSSIMGWRNSKWMEQRNETCSNVWIQTCVKWWKCNSVLELKQNSVWWGRLCNGKLCPCQMTKNCAGGSNLLGMLLYLKSNQPWMRNKLLFFPELLICYPPCQWIIEKKTSEKVILSSEWNKIQLYFETGHAMSRLCTGQASKALK